MDSVYQHCQLKASGRNIMNKDTYTQASKLADKIDSLNREIDLWDREINNVSDLAYRQSWNSNHATALNSQIDRAVFKSFRVLVMADLQEKLLKAEMEFREL